MSIDKSTKLVQDELARCRFEQLRAASEAGNEPGAVLGMGDWFTEELIISYFSPAADKLCKPK